MVDFDNKWQKIEEWQKRLSAYRMALTLTGVDAQNAPAEGAAFRSERRAVLAGEYQRVRADDAIYEILREFDADKDNLPDEVTRRTTELLLREMNRERAVPPETTEEYVRILECSIKAWPKAKAGDDFKGFAPCLADVFEKYKEITLLESESPDSVPKLSNSAFESPDSDSDGQSLTAYDRMLRNHQEGWDSRRYDRFFDGIRKNIPPLLGRIQEIQKYETQHPDKSEAGRVPASRVCPVEVQRRILPQINEYLGFSDSWGRMSESEHPLTTPLSAGDVRFTTKFREKDFALAVLSTVHEVGHAYHAHGIDPAFDGTILANAVSAGLCESQSRICENHLGRSETFWETILPLYRDICPEQDAAAFVKQLNRVFPTAIRIEADEVTYPLHILIRYELEKEIFDGGLMIIDLEEAWNEKYRHYLGISPENAAEGVLQDMHWPWGYFGYFPTYALGSAFAAQIYAAMNRKINVPELIRGHRYPEIMAWLKENVHRYGALYSAEEIIRKATGEDFDEQYYFAYLFDKYAGMR